MAEMHFETVAKDDATQYAGVVTDWVAFCQQVHSLNTCDQFQELRWFCVNGYTYNIPGVKEELASVDSGASWGQVKALVEKCGEAKGICRCPAPKDSDGGGRHEEPNVSATGSPSPLP
jgi:hypothetical protein